MTGKDHIVGEVATNPEGEIWDQERARQRELRACLWRCSAHEASFADNPQSATLPAGRQVRNPHLATRRPKVSGRCGAVLLEVVLALALFFISAGVIVGAMQASIRAADRVKQQAQANDLAISVQSWLDVGLVEPVDSPPEAFVDAPGWSWSIVTETLTSSTSLESPRKRVTVVITRDDGGFRHEVSSLVTGSEADPLAPDDWTSLEGAP